MEPPLKNRTVPMEVLVLGLCRSGTMSMSIALQELGYSKVYHFFEIDKHETHTKLWISALKAKYEPKQGKSKEFTTADWDNLLGDYSAVTDIPSACFAPELIAAYPAAKIILTTRSPTSWHNSMLKTIHALQTSYFNRFLLLFADTHTKVLSRLMDRIILYYFRGSISTAGKEVFEDHNEMVRKIAKEAKKDFLEFELGDGWGPLCGFLGKPVPDLDFPHVNDSEAFRRSFRLGWSLRDVAVWGLLVVSVFFGSCIAWRK